MSRICITLLLASALVGAGSAQDGTWVGKRVLMKATNVQLLDSGRKAIQDGLPLDVDSLKVVAEKDGRIQIEDFRGIVGWVKKDDTVLSTEALGYFSERIRRDSKDADAFVGRARSKVSNGEFDTAIDDMTSAIGLEPKCVEFYLYRAHIHSHSGKHEMACKDYSHAIRLDPKNVHALTERGQAWRYQKEYDKAIADFSAAIRLAPKGDLYNFRAIMWDLKKDYGKAIADLSEAIMLERRSVYYTNRGSCYVANKEYQKALQDYDDAEKLDPKRPWTYAGRAKLLATCADAKFRDGKRAVVDANKAFDLNKYPEGDIAEALAAAYAEVKNFEEAVRWQKRALDDANLKNDEGARRRLELYKKMQPYRQE